MCKTIIFYFQPYSRIIIMLPQYRHYRQNQFSSDNNLMMGSLTGAATTSTNSFCDCHYWSTQMNYGWYLDK